MPKGRIPKKPEEKRTNILRIRLTDAERSKLDVYASNSGVETSTWARMELLKLTKKSLK
jgi:hypothetical protein